MKVICAWCGKIIKEENPRNEKKQISHGICNDCSYELEYQSIPIQDFINSLKVPVAIVDSNGYWTNANKKTLKKLDKSWGEIAGKLNGEIIECIYADLPGGCGRTEHCSGCGMRKLVNEIYATGIPQNDVKVFQYLKSPNGVLKKELTLHAKKVNDKIVIVIEGW